MLIRTAVSEDAEQISAIYNHYVMNTVITFETQAVSISDMTLRIGDGSKKFPWLVAEEAGQLLGFAFASQWKTRAAYEMSVETTVYVAPDRLGEGIGINLYRILIDHLKDQRLHCALAGIALPNPASIALHEKIGFQKVGEFRDVGWKMGDWVNVGYWQLLL